MYLASRETGQAEQASSVGCRQRRRSLPSVASAKEGQTPDSKKRVAKFRIAHVQGD